MDKIKVSDYHDHHSTLVDVLQWRAKYQPDRIAYTFLEDGEEKEKHLTYSELDEHARIIAAMMQAFKLRNERALLVYDSGLDFISAFFGCLYANVVAVPVFPPILAQHISRLNTILRDSQSKIILTTSDIFARRDRWIDKSSELKDFSWIDTDRFTSGKEARESELAKWNKPGIDRDTIAFFQYTSGSTSDPKGVMVSHGNLMHNPHVTQINFELSEDSIVVSWLPMFHDMGLIGNTLTPLYVGFPCIFMSPISFLQKPLRWLRAISRYQAHISGAPNFAYEYCIKKITPEEKITLDLSCWQVAFNGAEPVHSSTLDKFAQAFHECGFKREAFYPCFGLAEATLIVSGGKKAISPTICNFDKTHLGKNNYAHEITVNLSNDAKSFVGCGIPVAETQVLIVDSKSLTICKYGEIGEIWIDGPSVAKGYWNNVKETNRVFNGYISDTGEGPFLRTGDLGFIYNNELYITGRYKDLIIIHGRNYYPQDFEIISEECDNRLQKGACAAFSVFVDNEEKLIIVQEAKKTFEKEELKLLADKIRVAISERFNLHVYNVVLIECHSILKTTSGKIQRNACKQAYLNDKLALIFNLQKETKVPQYTISHINHSATKTERLVIEIVAQHLKLTKEEISVTDNFFGLGGDSLKAVEIVCDLQTHYENLIDANIIFEYPVLRDLAIFLDENRIEQKIKKHIPVAEEKKLDNCNELFPVLPLQESFLINRDIGDIGCYIFMEITLSGVVDTLIFKDVLEFLNKKHPVFSISFIKTAKGYFQKYSSPPDDYFSFLDLTAYSEEDKNSIIAAEVERLEKYRFKLNISDPYKCVLIRKTIHSYTLIINFDHLIIDGSSVIKWLEELFGTYSKFVNKDKIDFSCHSFAAYQECFERLYLLDKSEFKNECKDFWLNKLINYNYFNPLSENLDGRDGFRCYIQKIPADLSKEIKTTTQRLNLTLFSLLFACFSKVIAEKSQTEKVIINTPFLNRKIHGIKEISDIQGCFTDIFPICLDFCQKDNLKNLASKVQREISLISKYNLLSAVEIQRILCSVHGYQKFQPISPIIFSSSLFPNNIENCIQNVTVDSLTPKTGAPATWLDVLVYEEKGKLSLSWNYHTNKYSEDNIVSMSLKLAELINLFANNTSDSRLVASKLLTSDCFQIKPKTEDVLYEPQNLCIHQVFEKQVNCYPDKIAISFNDEKYSYKFINEKSNQLARYILNKSGDKNNIGIFLNRSSDVIVSIIAILKAGKTYIPIDSDCPGERMNFIIENSDIHLLISQSSLKEKLLKKLNRQIIYIDEEKSQITKEKTDNLDLNIDPESLCYVIYTSGSTGKPKGVMICHRNVVRLFSSTQHWFNFTNKDNWCLFHSCAFDFSVWEIWGALFYGGTLVIVPYYISRFPRKFLDVIIKEEITVLNQTPSAFQQIMLGLINNHKDLKSLRLIIFGGEALQLPSLTPWFKSDISAHVQLVNMYGITETTVHVTYCSIKKEDVYQDSVSLIGVPIPDLQIYLLDANKNQVPAGEIGEIYIAGDGVAKGYLNNSSLTKERFLKNPHSTSCSNRIVYKSGDLGRYLFDGTLEYIGRSDNQVKIRGYRIELSEIDNVILRYPGVYQATTICTGKNKNIISYIVSDLFEDNDFTNKEELESKEGRHLVRFGLSNDRSQIQLDSAKYDCVVENISFSGAKVRSAFSFEHQLDHKIKLIITSNEKEFFIDGIIVWYSDECLGIKFDNPDPKRMNIRIPYNGTCYVAMENEQRDFSINNISKNGVSIIDEKFSLIQNEYVRIKFNLPNTLGPQWEVGKVKWREEEIVGIEFDQSSRQVRSGKRIRMAQQCQLIIGNCNSPLSGIINDFSNEGARIRIDTKFEQVNLKGIEIQLITKFPDMKNRFSVECKISWFADNQIGLVFSQTEKNKIIISEIYNHIITIRGLTIPKLKEFLSLNLPKYMIPSAIISLDTIPININGKIDTDALPNPADYLYQQTHEYTHPENMIEFHLLQIWEELLSIKMISTDENFFDIGGNSFLAVRLISRIKETYNVDIPAKLIFQSLTIRNLSSYIQKYSKMNYDFSNTGTQTQKDASNMVCIQPKGEKIPLFFIHPVGGNVYCYVNLSRALGIKQPFYAIQASGLSTNGNQQERIKNIHEMAELYLKEISEFQKEGPYRLGGWSMGGIIAFEIAQRLLKNGKTVDNVFQIDALLTSEYLNEITINSDNLIKRFIEDFYFSMGKRVILPEEIFAGNDYRSNDYCAADRLVSVVEYLIKCGMMDANSKEYMLKAFKVFISNIEVIKNYNSNNTFEGNLTYFRATETEINNNSEKLFLPSSVDYWGKRCKGKFCSFNIKGNHYSIMSKNNVSHIAKLINQI